MLFRSGFDACRFARVEDAWPAEARLRAFVAEGRHGTMGWMEETLERRVHPRGMWADARSAVVLGTNYGPDEDPLAALKDRTAANISVYARGDDYHELIKKRLKQLGRWMAERFGGELKVFVDTAPLMEKPLAALSGLGWQGKHTNLVSREFGSWLFLGSVLTTLDLPPDAPEIDHCGSCRACLDVCPTNAFPAPYQLDARACLSYLTIEFDGPWPERFRAALGNRIYGCDDCLAVCPWNKYARTAQQSKLAAREATIGPLLAELAALDDAAFRKRFAGTPVKRTGRDRFVRNVMIAIGNSDSPVLTASAQVRLSDASELVRAMAVWALRRLDTATFHAERVVRLPHESDADVRAEWERV